MTHPLAEMLSQAESLIEAGRGTVDKALSFVKKECSENGKVSAAKLDEYQLVSYELAYCAAELGSAETMVSYAARVRTEKGGQDALLEERLALVVVAEALKNCLTRLSTRRSDYGLSKDDLAQSFDSDAAESFYSACLKSQDLAALGKSLIELNGVTGEYLLEDEKVMMQDTFRPFAADVVAPLAEEIHRQDLDIPDEIIKPLVELGCFGLSIPMAYGGLQPDDKEDNLGMIVVTEELSRGSLGAAGSLITRPEIMSRALLKGGTEEQKQHWLPKLAEANPLCAVAVTEPNYGSDVASMKLKATKTDGGWLLNGAKTWCTFGGKAGVLLTLARTNPDASLGHRGLSMFLVEKPSTPGHEIDVKQEGGGSLTGKAISTIGYRGMHSFDLFFDNYFVPDSHLLGGPEGEGNGFYYTMAGFAGGRIQTAARATGVMQAAYEKAIAYSQEREVFGKPIGDYQLTLVKIARMAAWLTSSRQFTYGVARLMDEGKGQMEASLVKLITCKTSEWLCREAMQIHGGMGYAEETPVSRYFIDARVLSIFEGAEETLALKVIARNLIENAA